MKDEDENPPSVISSPFIPIFGTPETTRIDSDDDLTGPIIDLSDGIFDSPSITVRNPRRLLLVRNAERMDCVFPDWMERVFTSDEYYPYDVNQPPTLPQRIGSPSVFAVDSPVTELGSMISQLIGRALDADRITALITSPALCCVQTAMNLTVEMETAIENPIPICIEPALFDFVGTRRVLPCWMTTDGFLEMGFNVDQSYSPIDDRSTCQLFESETKRQYRARCMETVGKLLQRYKDPADIVLVTNALWIHWAVRLLSTAKPEVCDLDLTYPCGSVTVLEEVNDGGDWRFVGNALLPMTYVGYRVHPWLRDQ